MFLNSVGLGFGSRKKRLRVGRGIGSTKGKTCGRGHKGQHARSGGFHKVGFEGGQMPLQRRLPKVGFRSRSVTEQVGSKEIAKLGLSFVDKEVLFNNGLISSPNSKVKIMCNGELKSVVNLKGLAISKGVRLSIERLGGTIS